MQLGSLRSLASSRKAQAVAIVAVVGLAGRFLTPGTQIVVFAGLLAGILNAPRTDEWETSVHYGGLPGAYAALIVSFVLIAGIPLGYYSFPWSTSYDTTFDVLGPFVEGIFYVVVYFLEGVVGFWVVDHVPGVSSVQAD